MQEYLPFIQDNLILVIVWVGLLVALVVSIVKQKTARYKVVTPTEATLLVNRQDALMVDIRSKYEYRSGFIAGAIHMTAKDIKDGNLGNLEKNKSNPIIIICKTGQTSVESANHLIDANFEQVHILKDGMISWNEAKLPLVSNKKKK